MSKKNKSREEQIRRMEKAIAKFGDHDGSRAKKLEALRKAGK